jgi:hypothetical protein
VLLPPAPLFFGVRTLARLRYRRPVRSIRPGFPGRTGVVFIEKFEGAAPPESLAAGDSYPPLQPLVCVGLSGLCDMGFPDLLGLRRDRLRQRRDDRRAPCRKSGFQIPLSAVEAQSAGNAPSRPAATRSTSQAALSASLMAPFRRIAARAVICARVCDQACAKQGLNFE